MSLVLGAAGFIFLLENQGDPHRNYENARGPNNPDFSFISYFNAVYCCIVTMSTVGYGDYYPSTDFGKVFMIIFIMGKSFLGPFLWFTNWCQIFFRMRSLHWMIMYLPCGMKSLRWMIMYLHYGLVILRILPMCANSFNNFSWFLRRKFPLLNIYWCIYWYL